MQSNPFTPTRMIVVLFAATNFDAVHKLKGNRYSQIFDDLPDCIKDVEIMEECLQHYQISDYDIWHKLINENATSEEFDRVFFEIANELHEAHDANP